MLPGGAFLIQSELVDVIRNTALRCYAYRSGPVWEAICVALDIATFGDSLEEVKASLATGIEMHMEEGEAMSAADRERLLKRRSPWHVRTKLALMTWLSDLRGNAHRALQFTLQSRAASPP